MRADVTEREIQSYRENGFVVIPDLLDRDELDDWRAAVDGAVRERGERMLPHGREMDVSQAPEELKYYLRVFKQSVNLWQTDATMKRLMINRVIGKLAADLTGVDGMRCWHDQALIKLPFANPTAYHLDVPYWSFTSPHAISIWVALDDATLENGCMWYVPGSQKAEKFDNVGIGKEIGAIFDVYPEWREIAPAPAPVKAGGCVFHSGLVAHGAGANMTSGYRRAMTMGMMPDGATFNGQQNILTDEQIARLKIGDALNDERQNPLLYSRSGAPAGIA